MEEPVLPAAGHADRVYGDKEIMRLARPEAWYRNKDIPVEFLDQFVTGLLPCLAGPSQELDCFAAVRFAILPEFAQSAAGWRTHTRD